jgi:hypothetical protein
MASRTHCIYFLSKEKKEKILQTETWPGDAKEMVTIALIFLCRGQVKNANEDRWKKRLSNVYVPPPSTPQNRSTSEVLRNVGNNINIALQQVKRKNHNKRSYTDES